MSLCSVSDICRRSSTHTTTFSTPSFSAESLGHKSSHPDLQTPSLDLCGHSIHFLTTSPLYSFLWWHFKEIFTKLPIVKQKTKSEMFLEVICQQNISSNMYSISCKVLKIDVFTSNCRKCMHIYVYAFVHDKALFRNYPILIVLEASLLSVTPSLLSLYTSGNILVYPQTTFISVTFKKDHPY